MEPLGQFDPYYQFYSSIPSPGPSTDSQTPHRRSPAEPELFTPNSHSDRYHAPPQDDPEPPAPEHDDNTLDEEPLYVNAKQYYRILKRRVARARLEEVHRLSKQRKVRLLGSFCTKPGCSPQGSLTCMNPATNMPCVALVVQAAGS